MEFALLGWPEDGPTLRLDHREFAYAGKFVMGTTGKAVARARSEGGEVESEHGEVESEHGEVEGEAENGIVGAVAFGADRTDPATAWLRYVTVRADRRGDGIGPRLCAFVVARLAERGYGRVRIAVNNPFAFEALHKVGFAWTGEETGLAELVLERPTDGPAAASARESNYRAGLDEYRARDGQSAGERAFLADREGDGPPAILAAESDGAA